MSSQLILISEKTVAALSRGTCQGERKQAGTKQPFNFYIVHTSELTRGADHDKGGPSHIKKSDYRIPCEFIFL